MIRATSLLLCCLTLAPSLAAAQTRPREAPKRGLPVIAARAACPTVARRPIPPTTAQRRDARDLAQRGRQAAILGDRAAARDQLRQAATLDPTDPDLSFQLARAQEAAASPDDASAEYCRYLSLAPNAPEAAEARDRIAALSRATQTATSDRVLSPFRAGITAYEAGRMPQAETFFGEAIQLQPDWPEAWFNRALSHAARGNKEFAVRDFQQYLRLRPEADDRAAVIARITALRGGPLSASSALAFGLVLPGAGQFYTGRKLPGLMAMGAAAGAIAFALKTDPTVVNREETADLPFGGTYTYSTSEVVVGRPYLGRWMAAAGVVTIVGAVEAYVHARHLNAREQRLSATIIPSADGVALRLTLR